MKNMKSKKSDPCQWLTAFFAFLMVLTLSLTSSGQNDACKTVVTLGISGFFSQKPGEKPKQHSSQSDVESMSKLLAQKLSEGTKVSARYVTNFSLERDFREKAQFEGYADVLLFIEMKASIDRKSRINFACGIGIGRSCAQPEIEFELRYRAIDAANQRLLVSGTVKGKSANPNDAAVVVANEVNSKVGDAARIESVETVSVERLKRKNRCLSQFPSNAKSLILDYDVQAAGKLVSYRYQIQNGLWRVDTTTGNRRFAVGFNGQSIWDSDGRKLQQVNVKTGLEFFLSDLAPESGLEDPESRVMSSRILKSTETVNGESCYVVESTTSAETLIRTYYSTATGALIKKSKFDNGQAAIEEVFFEDYRKVNGILFPFRISSRSKSGKVMIVFKQEQGIVINPNIDERIFRGGR